MQPLPPQAVTGLDNRTAQCSEGLKKLVAKYRMVAAGHGTAGAIGALAIEIATTTPIASFQNVVDLLVVAVSELAEKTAVTTDRQQVVQILTEHRWIEPGQFATSGRCACGWEPPPERHQFHVEHQAQLIAAGS